MVNWSCPHCLSRVLSALEWLLAVIRLVASTWHLAKIKGIGQTTSVIQELLSATLTGLDTTTIIQLCSQESTKDSIQDCMDTMDINRTGGNNGN